MLRFIMKTRDGQPLSQEDFNELVAGIVDDTWPDYQVAAWLMAAYCRGLTDEETLSLTGAMAFTGAPSWEPLGLVDKHSTGGVGDKTTLLLAPIMGAMGLPMAKMSGRGLGHTGGTLDKLESIPGFRVELSLEEIRSQVEKIGVAVVAQSGELAPSDRRLYALRDVTGTVDSIPLIASSVMAKKLASGTHHLVLDVKVGNGAFMSTVERARQLAHLMVHIGEHYGRRVSALLTAMDQPLGWAVGNALEVNEASDCLRGQGPEDLREEVITLAAELACLARPADLRSARQQVQRVLDSGQAWEWFGRWVAAQGGQFKAVEQGLPLAPVHYEWRAESEGIVSAVNTRMIGEVALELGAGRHQLGDPVDFGVGLQCYAKIGRRFLPGERLASVYARTPQQAEGALRKVQEAVSWGQPPSTGAHLILERIGQTEDGHSGMSF